LIEYCGAIGNISTVKRIAFLTEFLGKGKMTRFLKYAATEVNARYVLFDPFGNEAGTFNNKWKLRLNISEEEIQSIIHKNY
jgi:predicted transcriptional regulator of viral defense system